MKQSALGRFGAVTDRSLNTKRGRGGGRGGGTKWQNPGSENLAPPLKTPFEGLKRFAPLH